MNRNEFMERLEQLLGDIPLEERVEALAYYNGYFEDAGPENEARIIRELESPEAVAAIIKADIGVEEEKEYTETGYQDTRFQQKEAMESRRSEGQTGDGAEASGSGTAGTSDFHTAGSKADFAGSKANFSGSKADFSRNKADSAGSQSNGSQDPNRTLKIVLLVIAAVLTSPLWLAVLGTLAGMLLGVVGTVIGILLAFSVTVLVFYLLGFLFGGISVSIFAAGGIASGLGLLGSGLILLALALAGTVGCVWLYGKFLPWMFRGIALLCRRLFQGRRSAA